MDKPSLQTVRFADEQVTMSLRPLTLGWLALVALTLLSLELGHWLHGVVLLQYVVALIIGFKGWLVARYFIEAQLANRFIRRVLTVFICFAPLCLLLLAHFGPQLAEFTNWTA